MLSKFTQSGRLTIPPAAINKDQSAVENQAPYIIEEAYCPKGCKLLNEAYPINGAPGLHIKFRRHDMEGEFILSAIEGDLKKIILSGTLADGVKDELLCPHCDALFETLTACNCKNDADLVVLGLTQKLDFNNAVAFCNVTGCENAAVVKSGHVLRHAHQP